MKIRPITIIIVCTAVVLTLFACVFYAYAGWMLMMIYGENKTIDRLCEYCFDILPLSITGRWLLIARLEYWIEKKGESAAVIFLTKMLDDKMLDVREKAVIVLGKIGTNEALNSLVKALNDPHHLIRYRALCMVCQSDENVGKYSVFIVKMLRDPEPGIRKATAIVLGNTGVKGNIPVLATALEDESDIEVRQEIKKALQKLESYNSNTQGTVQAAMGDKPHS